MNYKYDEQIDPRIHIEAYIIAWLNMSVDEWVHLFVHTLDTIPKNWYTETELHKGSENWSLMIDGFNLTFEFESEYPGIGDALEVIRTKKIQDGPLPLYNQLDWVAQVKNVLECYNLAVDEDEEPHNVNIPESQGSHEVQGLKLEVPEIDENFKIKKINIGTEADPKFASIGYYWDDEIVGHIANLLQEYQDLFPTKFTKMKGILGDMGVMRIPLKLVIFLLQLFHSTDK